MTPWQWEMQIIDSEYEFYINEEDLIIDIGYYQDRLPWGIVQGKWTQETKEFLNKEKIEVDYGKRGFYN